MIYLHELGNFPNIWQNRQIKGLILVMLPSPSHPEKYDQLQAHPLILAFHPPQGVTNVL